MSNVQEKKNSTTQHFDDDALRVLRRTIARDLSDSEFDLFVEVCKKSGLDPFSRQIYAVKRGGRMMIQTGIDGFRALAERTRRYAGQNGPFWCGDDGKWVDVWLSRDPPRAAKIEILRSDFTAPIVAVALWDEYAQQHNGGVSSMWAKFQSVMLAKCAESIGLRRAFPQEMFGLYTSEEMDQAGDVDAAPRRRQPQADADGPVRSPVAAAPVVVAPSASKRTSAVDHLLRAIAQIDAASTWEELEAVDLSAVSGNEKMGPRIEAWLKRKRVSMNPELGPLTDEENKFVSDLSKLSPSPN